MPMALWFGTQAVFVTFYVWICATVGILNDVFAGLTPPTKPDDGGFFDKLIAPFIYAWDMASALFQFVTFQPVGIDPMIGIPITLFVSTVDIILIIKLIRGTN